MRFSLLIIVPLLLVALAAPVPAQDPVPRFSVVDPYEGKAGQVISITGENIGKEVVAELYLTDGTKDFKMTILEQTATSMKAKIPETMKAGGYRLMVLTKGKEPKLIVQPVRYEVQEVQS